MLSICSVHLVSYVTLSVVWTTSSCYSGAFWQDTIRYLIKCLLSLEISAVILRETLNNFMQVKSYKMNRKKMKSISFNISRIWWGSITDGRKGCGPWTWFWNSRRSQTSLTAKVIQISWRKKTQERSCLASNLKAQQWCILTWASEKEWTLNSFPIL